MPDDEFRIQLRVAKKVYPVFCKRSEEGLYRKAAKAVDDKINQYNSRFPEAKLELEDYLVMTAMHISLENLKIKQQEDTSPVFERIVLLDKELNDYLQSVISINLN